MAAVAAFTRQVKRNIFPKLLPLRHLHARRSGQLLFLGLRPHNCAPSSLSIASFDVHHGGCRVSACRSAAVPRGGAKKKPREIRGASSPLRRSEDGNGREGISASLYV